MTKAQHTPAPELLELLEALREIGQALERGDPQDIADKWFSLGVPAIAKAEGN